MSTINYHPILIILAFILLGFFSKVDGRSTGAPIEACISMTPQHGDITAQENRPVYHLHTHLTSARQDPSNPNSPRVPCFNVTLGSHDPNQQIAGFLLQGRTEENIPFGSFQSEVDNNIAQLMDCADGIQNSATHVSGDLKSSISFLWFPPPNYKGTFTFKATVVQDFNTFWTGISSSRIRI